MAACARLRVVVGLTVLALVASLASKTVSLQCGQGTSLQSGSEAAKNQKFERSGPQWSVPVAHYVLPIRPVEVTRVAPSPEALLSFQSDESLYIRPPPVAS